MAHQTCRPKMFRRAFRAQGPPKKAAWMTILWRDIQQKKPKVRLMEEVRRLPVDMVNIPVFTVFFYILGGCLGFLNHEQYFTPKRVACSVIVSF